MKIRLLALAVVAFVGVMPAAHAQWAVIDSTNLVQNTLTAVRTMQMIENQINQLQNQAQMLVNQGRNLTSLPFNVVSRLQLNLATTQQLITQAQGLAFQVQSMDQQFAQLYPQQFAATVSGNQMYQDAHQRWQNTLTGLQTAMQMQAQVSQNVTTDQGVLTDLVGQSQSATGALQAQQATNQLLALQAKQSIQAQQLQLTQGRAASLELARQAAAVEQGRVITQRFLGPGTPYTPQAVSFYGN
ncbi:P-type conjugative transfer protein TrbJ [Burkholderia pseudomallei]|uniref:P-type conjugative transfer protein TrbJ n=1 Tax=Burkholderia pseudomallei TaxID=28450 RepID=UPI000F077185|nr:P-type conjugative transfer protein TrbJ [Burkholderia pseudomallei]CAJ2815928.1 P-type conjugative transfer protein TrbJ [Burkholderia pseudomallei]VCD15439.1 P-type conjugative transfer protein TrbJ [Burkholderia pseudomallei]VCD19241.1 P-type conjugative transfer protein TrbJ [Burkholderia pseudomallei]VCD27690.1 P-type conjugative transfer protein TrbJ [Burkholderia pseudomallei]VCD28086.1 P-type conjugative transfer protein TrbJ [Burkholderia pseudomallei]